MNIAVRTLLFCTFLLVSAHTAQVEDGWEEPVEDVPENNNDKHDKFEQIDTKGDGVIDFDEFSMNAKFEQMDTNGDRAIDFDEFSSATKSLANTEIKAAPPSSYGIKVSANWKGIGFSHWSKYCAQFSSQGDCGTRSNKATEISNLGKASKDFDGSSHSCIWAHFMQSDKKELNICVPSCEVGLTEKGGFYHTSNDCSQGKWKLPGFKTAKNVVGPLYCTINNRQFMEKTKVKEGVVNSNSCSVNEAIFDAAKYRSGRLVCKNGKPLPCQF